MQIIPVTHLTSEIRAYLAHSCLIDAIEMYQKDSDDKEQLRVVYFERNTLVLCRIQIYRTNERQQIVLKKLFQTNVYAAYFSLLGEYEVLVKTTLGSLVLSSTSSEMDKFFTYMQISCGC